MAKNVTISKQELLELRTEKNKLRKCINRIDYLLDHIKREPYDYGEGSDNALESIRDIIRETY